MTRLASCARRCSPRIRISCASARSRPATPADIEKLAKLGGAPDKAPFTSAVGDFYLTNPIARASAVMAECSALASGRPQDGGGVGAHGFLLDLSLAG